MTCFASVPVVLGLGITSAALLDPDGTGRLDVRGVEWLVFWLAWAVTTLLASGAYSIGWWLVARALRGRLARTAGLVTGTRRLTVALGALGVVLALSMVLMNAALSFVIVSFVALLVGAVVLLAQFIASHLLVMQSVAGDRKAVHAAGRAVVCVPICVVISVVAATDMTDRYDILPHVLSLVVLVGVVIAMEWSMLARWRAHDRRRSAT